MSLFELIMVPTQKKSGNEHSKLSRFCSAYLLSATLFAFPFIPILAQDSSLTPEAMDKDFPVLTEAVLQNNLIQVCTLLMEGENPNLVDESGHSLLHMSLKAEMTEMLINHGGQVDQTDHHGETPLLVAAYDGDPERVEVLLRYKADPNIPNTNYYTPLLMVLEQDDQQNKRTDIVDKLLQHGANPNVGTRFSHTTPLYYAIKSRNLKAAKLLVENNAQINGLQGEEGSPLDLADPNIDMALFEFLRKKGARHYSLRNKLLKALYENDTKSVKSILERKIDLNFYFEGVGFSPLIVSIKYFETTEVAELFINNGANIMMSDTATGQSPLQMAIFHNFPLPFIQWLIVLGADVNAADHHDWTPLMYAALYDRSDLMTLLIKNGAKVDALNDDRQTAQEVAESAGLDEIVRVLESYK